MRLRHGVIAAGVAALSTLAPMAACAANDSDAQPIRLTAAFDPDARPGANTALHLGLKIDTDEISSPVTEIRLRYPAGLGVTTSGLGLDACSRPTSYFAEVVVTGTGLAGCPPNAVLARGTVAGEIRLGTKVIPEMATINLLAGPLQRRGLKLIALVEGWNPIGALLAYAGTLAPAPAPFGGVIALSVPQIPADYDASLALTDLRLAIGADDIIYHHHVRGRTVAFRPGGIVLPDRCPRTGYHFRSWFRFQDGTSRTATATVRCPTPRLDHRAIL